MGICKNQTTFGILIGVSAIIVLISIFQPYMWKDDFLGKWASLVTILSLVVIPATYFSKLDKKEKDQQQEIIDERNLASRNLYGELHDALVAMDGKKYPKDLLDVKINDKTMTYTNRFLNHDMYDGLIFSGKISFLRYELQQKIQDIYKKIKHHNYYLRYIAELHDKDESTIIPESTIRYYELLDKDEKSLLIEIPFIMKKLKDEFKFELPI